MSKYLPHGTTFSFGGVQVLGLIKVGVPTRKRGTAETTDSASAFQRSFIAGLRDPGQVKLEFRDDPADAGQNALLTNFSLDTSANLVVCILTLPPMAGATNKIYTFTGFVVECETGDLGLVEETAAVFSAIIQVVGAVVIT